MIACMSRLETFPEDNNNKQKTIRCKKNVMRTSQSDLHHGTHARVYAGNDGSNYFEPPPRPTPQQSRKPQQSVSSDYLSRLFVNVATFSLNFSQLSFTFSPLHFDFSPLHFDFSPLL
jgi:hypothetical protein